MSDNQQIHCSRLNDIVMKMIKTLIAVACACAFLAGSAFADQAKCCAKAAKDGKTCDRKSVV